MYVCLFYSGIAECIRCNAFVFVFVCVFVCSTNHNNEGNSFIKLHLNLQVIFSRHDSLVDPTKIASAAYVRIMKCKFIKDLALLCAYVITKTQLKDGSLLLPGTSHEVHQGQCQGLFLSQEHLIFFWRSSALVHKSMKEFLSFGKYFNL